MAGLLNAVLLLRDLSFEPIASSSSKVVTRHSFKSNQVHRLSEIMKWLCLSESSIDKLGLGMGMIFCKKRTHVFCFELIILFCLAVPSWFALENFMRDKERTFGDVSSHEKALSYCPPSLLNNSLSCSCSFTQAKAEIHFEVCISVFLFLNLLSFLCTYTKLSVTERENN